MLLVLTLRIAFSFVIFKHTEDLAVIMKIAKKYLCIPKLSDWATGEEEKAYQTLPEGTGTFFEDLKAEGGQGNDWGPAGRFASR